MQCFTSAGGVCPQDLSVIDTFPIHVDRPALVSEDCLHVNIWTPSIDCSSRLPVMVWIFGGGFMTGENALATNIYD
jgi:carboxylesterase type B